MQSGYTLWYITLCTSLLLFALTSWINLLVCTCGQITPTPTGGTAKHKQLLVINLCNFENVCKWAANKVTAICSVLFWHLRTSFNCWRDKLGESIFLNLPSLYFCVINNLLWLILEVTGSWSSGKRFASQKLLTFSFPRTMKSYQKKTQTNMKIMKSFVILYWLQGFAPLLFCNDEKLPELSLADWATLYCPSHHHMPDMF